MFVKPKEGISIRDPETKRLLPADGAEVPANGYWGRRLRDGDVIEATASSQKASPKSA